MRALTLWQPWASLMAMGLKQHETRSWGTKHVGPLAIHAAKKSPRTPGPLVVMLAAHWGIKVSAAELVLEQMPVGSVVGVVDLVGCQSTLRCDPQDLDRALGDYGPDRFAWLTRDPAKLADPIACRGRQGLWRLRPEVADRVIVQLRAINAA